MNSRRTSAFLRAISAALALWCSATALAQFQTCVDVNAPINTSTGATSQQIQPSTIAGLATNRVRINCIIAPWSSPSDSTLHSGRTWFQAYDQIVNDFIAQGTAVYMLIGGQAVNSGFGLNTSQYADQYAANFETIVGHFKDRVQVFETFNEPNDWAGGSSAQVEPRYFAYMLQEIYMNVKYRDAHVSDPTWQVTIVSGPMFTHDISGDGDLGNTYFTSTANAGKNGDAAIPSLDWNNVKTLTGSYPYDGIGYHIYARQGSTDAADISARLDLHLDSMMSAVDTIEGTSAHGKKFWISEIGWGSNHVTPDGQAANLDTALNLFRSDARVQMATWFCLADFDPGNQYGLHTDNALLVSQRKPAWWHLRRQSLVADATTTLARNPGFESAAQYWTSFGTSDGVQSGSWFGGITARTGSSFWGAAANFGVKNGGVYQQYFTTAGQTITAATWVRTYREGGSFGNTTGRIGIDPAGGTNPDAGSVVWSDLLESPGAWHPVVARTTATGAMATVFLRHVQSAPTWNVTAFDDVTVLGATSAVPVQVTAVSAD
ncbi:MAG: hypothetical protein ACR2IE_01405 [Candidatus Sumerlaeaceae bacterium]